MAAPDEHRPVDRPPEAELAAVGARPGPVAYVMSRFPKISETFILNEIIELRRRGVLIEIFPLVREREEVMHPEVADLVRHAHYAPVLSLRVLVSQVAWLVRAPRRYLGAWARVLRGNLRSRAALIRSLYIVPQAATFARELRTLGVEHVHAHYATYPALTAYVIHCLVGLPYSFTAHAHDIYVDRTMLAEKLAAASFAVTISNFNRDLLRRLYGGAADQVHVVRCGVDTDLFRPAPRAPHAELTVLCVGSLQEYKGQAYLVQACELLVRRGVQLRCLLVGEGRDRRELEHLVGRLGLEQVVSFLGSQPRDVVQRLLGRADVFALPSVTARDGQMEGIPVALMEALASGVPVVASDLSGIGELVEHEGNGLLVPERDAEQLADALSLLADDEDLRQQFGRAGRQTILTSFQLDENVAQLHALFGDSRGAHPFRPKTGAEASVTPRDGPAREGRPLRVLQVIDDLGRGGAQTVLLGLLRLRDPATVDMHVAAVSSRYDPTLVDEIRAASSGVTILGAHGLWDVPALARLRRLVRELDIDVIHTHLAVADVAGGVVGMLTRIPVVASLHSVAADRHTHPARRRLPAGYATRHLATELVAVSDAVKETLVSALGVAPSRISVVRNVPLGPLSLSAGFQPERKRQALGVASGTSICMAARFALPKDHDTLLRALALVIAHRPDTTLLLAGDGPRRDELKALTEQLGLSAHVRFLGVRSDVPELLSAVDIVCNVTHEAEGLSITVLDGLSLGRPVVATRIPSVAEVIDNGETGFLVPPRDPKSMAETLVRLLEQPALRDRVGEQARAASVARSDPGLWMAEFEATYRRLAERDG